VQTIQLFNIEYGMNDVNFNFLITKFGIFEGRGWEIRPQFPRRNDSLYIDFMIDDSKRLETYLNRGLKFLVSIGKSMDILSGNGEVFCGEELCGDF
jgi:hypothetical protein